MNTSAKLRFSSHKTKDRAGNNRRIGGFFMLNAPEKTCSTAYNSVKYLHRAKNYHEIFGGFDFSPYLCRRVKDSSKLLSEGDCIRLRLHAVGFFYA